MKFSFLKKVGDSFLDLAYPQLCIHCNEKLGKECEVVCQECSKSLILLDPKNHCPKCFVEYENVEKCTECSHTSSSLTAVAAAFDYVPPSSTFVTKIKYGNSPHLAKGCGGYLAAQFLELGWPFPDIIVPVPISWTHWISRGYNQSYLLSKSLGTIIERPVEEMLVRKSGDYSQAALTKEKRMQMKASSIQLRDCAKIENKCILLIDDVMTTGTTLRKCGDALLEGYPAKIYALTLCRTM